MHTASSNRNHIEARSNAHIMNNRRTASDDRILSRLGRAISDNWGRRKMIAALRSMDDHLLKDIGIYRNDIERVVNGAYARDTSLASTRRTAGYDSRYRSALRTAAE